MELLSTKLAMQMFSKTLKHKATHLQVGNKVVLNLTYLLKMGGGVPNKIWTEFEITPISKRNMESSSPMWSHFSECKFVNCVEPRRKINLLPDYLIRSRVNLREAGSIKPSSRCLPTKLVPQKPLRFSPILLDPKVFEQSSLRKDPMIIFGTPAWTTQLRYPEAMRMSIQLPILLTWSRDLFKKPKGDTYPFVHNKTLTLVAWTFSGLNCKRDEFQGRLPTLSLSQQDQVLTRIGL